MRRTALRPCRRSMIPLASNLNLPLGFQTERSAIIASSGGGKTYAALKVAEGMFDSNLQFVFIDPLGVAWGLLHAPDGSQPGLDILVFGGDHGDVAIEVDSAEIVADYIVEKGVSCVVDTSHLRRDAEVQFMTNFAEGIFSRKVHEKSPLHLFIDEADRACPQVPQKDERPMLGAIEDLVRRGRSRGIGVTLISQRAAVLNKNALTQCETILMGGVGAVQDRKAFDDLMRDTGEDEVRKQVLPSLATLETGEMWVWSPRFLKTVKRIKVDKRRTYDSSATPEAGQSATVPQARGDLGRVALLEELREAMQRDKEGRPPEHVAVSKKKRDQHRRPSGDSARGVDNRAESIVSVQPEARHLERDGHQVRLTLTLELPLSTTSVPQASGQPAGEKRVKSPQPDASPGLNGDPPARQKGSEKSPAARSESKLKSDDVVLLTELSRSGQTKQALLISTAGIRDRSKAARRLRVLEGQGFIARSTDPDDRRTKLVRLMPKGRDALDQEQETGP
jgi:MarR family